MWLNVPFACRFSNIVYSLQSYFTSYFSKITNVLTELRKLCGLDGNIDKVSLDDVKDLPDSHEEWVEFQLAFQLIQCCG